jgi:multisubunit Na+/H+ antiporter MnhB subunit
MNAPSPLLARAVPLLHWLLLAAAGWFLLRGHNAPGGGFVAGLAAVSATSAVALALGRDAARRCLPVAPLPLAAGGVVLALAAGLPAVLLGKPYLTHLWFDLSWAGLTLPLSTVLIFDLGVLLAVWGTLAGFILDLLPDTGETP